MAFFYWSDLYGERNIFQLTLLLKTFIYGCFPFPESKGGHRVSAENCYYCLLEL